MDANDTTNSTSDDVDPFPALQVVVANQHADFLLEDSRIKLAVRSVVENSAFRSALVSIALVDDSTMRQLNRQYLQHDYPTDVLSFVLEVDQNHLEGEVIVSVDTAIRSAAEYGWSASDELLLYIVHGALHLVGYQDKTPAERKKMQAAEAHLLEKLGVVLPDASEHRPQNFQGKISDEVRAL